MHNKMSSLLAIFVVMTLSTSCLHAAPVDQEEMLGLSSALTKVSAPVHSAVRYKNPPPELSDQELLDFALKDFMERLDRFKGYVLKARQEGKNSSVLVCDQMGRTALIEDTGCTGDLDERIWETHPDQPCDYILNLERICATE